MKFLELINKCLLELNYKEIHSLAELVKNDHKRIVSILNIINKEICNIEGWNFLLRRTFLTLPAGSTEIKNTVDGRILYLFIDGRRYDYNTDVESFVSNNPKTGTYSSFAQNLLFPIFKTDKKIDIIYYTDNCVIDSNSKEKKEFENPDDKSLIPMPFAEQILVYGTCLRLKANPQYYKFSYWMSMYKEALANLKSKAEVSVLNAPVISLYRR